MVLRGESGRQGGNGSGGQFRCPEPLFAVLADDGFGWHRIGPLHADARTACLTVALYINLLRPELGVSELEALAVRAVPALETGAVSVTVIDARHRVDRIEPVPGPGSRDTSRTTPADHEEAFPGQ